MSGPMCQKRAALDCVDVLRKRGKLLPSEDYRCQATSYMYTPVLEGRVARRSDNSDTLSWSLPAEEVADVPEVPAPSVDPARQESSQFCSSSERLHAAPECRKSSFVDGSRLVTARVSFDSFSLPELKQQMYNLELQECALLATLRQERHLYDARVTELLSGSHTGIVHLSNNSATPAQVVEGELGSSSHQPTGMRSAWPVSARSASAKKVKDNTSISRSSAETMPPPPPRPPRTSGPAAAHSRQRMPTSSSAQASARHAAGKKVPSA